MAAPQPAKQQAKEDDEHNRGDETDMTEMERKVREAVAEGLLPGVSKLFPVGDGINKKLDIAIVDVKPWDDETDMAELENKVREIVADGLLWGVAKLVPIGYGINKLRIAAVIEEDKVSTDWLVETIEELEDFVQSVDIAAFHKV